MPDTYTLPALEIAAAGDNLNGVPVTLDDLANMVTAFDALRGRIDPPLKLEHDKEQLAPAVGWPSRLYVLGKKLVADYRDVPRLVYELIKQGAYRKISPEIYWNLTEPETGIKYPCVLGGAALLGADLPAMTSLATVAALYSAAGVRAEGWTFDRALRLSFDVRDGAITGASKFTLMDLSAALSDLGYCAGYYQSRGDTATESSVRDLIARVTALMAKIAKNEQADCNETMAAVAAYQARIPALMAQAADGGAKPTTRKDDTMTPEQEARFKALEATEKQALADAAELEKLRAERKQFEADAKAAQAAKIEAEASKFVADNSTEANFRIIPAEREPMKRLFVRIAEANGTLRKFAVAGAEVSALDDLKALVAARKPLAGLFKTYSAHTDEPSDHTPATAREAFAAKIRETRIANPTWSGERVMAFATSQNAELVAAMEGK